jgi:hypothetical protein
MHAKVKIWTARGIVRSQVLALYRYLGLQSHDKRVDRDKHFQMSLFSGEEETQIAYR